MGWEGVLGEDSRPGASGGAPGLYAFLAAAFLGAAAFLAGDFLGAAAFLGLAAALGLAGDLAFLGAAAFLAGDFATLGALGVAFFLVTPAGLAGLGLAAFSA